MTTRTCLARPPCRPPAQAANVHTIMLTVPMADSVVFQIKKTLALLGG